MIKPSSPQEFRREGYGKFKVVYADGKTMARLDGRPDTCCPSFWIRGTFNEVRPGVLKMNKEHTYTYEKKNPKEITRADVNHFLRELSFDGGTSARIVEYRKQLYDAVPCTVADFTKKPFFEELKMKALCDYFRVDYEIPLKLAMGDIRELAGEHLEEVHWLLFNRTWKLWFSKYCKPFGIKEMTLKGYNKFRLAYKIQHPFMLQTAMRLYSYIKEQRELGDDAFPRAELICNYLKTTGARDYNDAPLIEQALVFLMFHALEEPFPGILALSKDVLANRVIAEGLGMVRSSRAPRARSAPYSPCIPSVLSDIQRRVVQHVHRNKLTLLQGAPGTGKTEVLVAIMTEFKAPLVVTYVGMMVDALQKRFGGREETANTIHYVCAVAEFSEEWLCKFDLLVIDEGSNMDTHLFARLLRHVACHVCRIVIVGDLGQIFPIKPGCPFYDLLHAYPQHTFELYENKRVDPDSRALAEASSAISRGQLVEFNRVPALRMLPELNRETLARVLREYVHTQDDVMKMQIVTLRNADRKMLNIWIEEILMERGILRRQAVVFLGEFAYFPGKKVMFTKNVKPSEGFDGFRNGELGQVASVAQNGVIRLTNGKTVSVAQNPFYVQPGYATTSNKSQGSEWVNILFWIYETPTAFFSREYAYVAVSRAKKQCTVIGSQTDFNALCSRKARPRNTLLRHYLGPSEPIPYEDVELRDPAEIIILPADKAAVPKRPNPRDQETGENTTKRGKREGFARF